MHPSGWIAFTQEFEAYRARGGQTLLNALVAADVVEVATMAEGCTRAEIMAGDRLQTSISKLFSPKSKQESRARFASIQMSSTLSVESYAKYVLQWNQVENTCSPETLPSQKARIEIFLNGLQCRPLREDLAALDLEDLRVLRREGFKIVAELVQIKSRADKFQISRPQGPSGHRQHEQRKEALHPPPPQSEDSGRRSAVRCFNCNRLGHYASQCRSKPAEVGAREKPSAHSASLDPLRAHGPSLQAAAQPSPQALKDGPVTRSMSGRKLNHIMGPSVQWIPSELPSTVLQVRPVGSGHQSAVSTPALIDTGSTVNVVSDEIARQMVLLGAQSIQQETPLDLGGTSTRVVSSSRVRLAVNTVGVKAVSEELDFVVLNTAYSVILGYSAVRSLGLISLNVIGAGESMQGILDDYAELFTDNIATAATVTPFEINLLNPSAAPIYCAPRRQPLALQAVTSEQVRIWLELGVVRKSTSPYNSRVVLAKKKDGTYRVCLDFRALNQETVTTPFPLPNIGSVLERLQGSRYFCRLDLSSGFLQVPLSEESARFTAFSTEDGHFEFLRMPFGLRNAPLHFQSVMTEVLGPILHRGAEDYMDDCLIHSPTMEGLCGLLRRALELLKAHGLRLNRKKCLFGVEELDFLGHTVSERGIAVSESRKEALKSLPTPTTLKQLRQLLGSWNYVRDHIADFSVIAAPLFALLAGRKTSKHQPLVWTPQATSALSSLRYVIDKVPLLHFVDSELPLVLEADASEAGLGGVLFQEDKVGNKLVIAYISKSFTGASSRWMMIEKEAFAIYFAVTKLRHFLLGRPFTVRSDCKNLLFSNSSVAKIQRWTLRLQEFDFVVEHIKGSANVVADGLSRLNLISGDQQELIRKVHGGPSGHHGVNRTLQCLRAAGFTWESMTRDVKNYISNCSICEKMMQSTVSEGVSLGNTMTDAPFDVVALDLVGPLPVDTLGNTYILVAVDVFSRFTWMAALPNKVAETVARALLGLIGSFGIVPRKLRTEHGSEFTAAITNELFGILGTEVELTVTDHPSSNGIVERMNQNVMKQLRCLAAETGKASAWSGLLPFVQRIVNTTPNRTTGLTPMRIIFGKYAQDFPSLLGPGTIRPVELVDIVQSQDKALAFAKANQTEYVQKYLAQSPVNPKTFSVGDWVLARHRGDAPPSKLSPRYRGPYEVVRQTGTNRYDIKHLATEHMLDVHGEHLKEFLAESLKAAQEAADLDTQIDKEYLVEALVNHKFTRRPHNLKNIRFKIRWVGWGERFDSWANYTDVKDLVALDSYLEQHPYLSSLVPVVGQDLSQTPTPVLKRGGVASRTASVTVLPLPEGGTDPLSPGTS